MPPVSLRESVLALEAEEGGGKRDAACSSSQRSSIDKHRDRRRSNMGRHRPSGIVEGILYDMYHFERFGARIAR